MARYDYKKLRRELLQRTARTVKNIDVLYKQAFKDISREFALFEYDPLQPFSFERFGKLGNVDSIMSRLEAQIQEQVNIGIEDEFRSAYSDIDNLIKQVVGESVAKEAYSVFMPLIQSSNAAKVFISENAAGNITRSMRVWDGAALGQMETAVQEALMEGMPSQQMAGVIEQYLKDPDSCFRRFRIKAGVDAEGKSMYGRKWKKRVRNEDGTVSWFDADPRDYPVGAGVYHSSYKNAMRYARTTTNIAYRTADYERYQQLDFVLGIDIRTTSNPAHKEDICDMLAGHYPKEFKWTGWHPQCMCYQVPILATPEEINAMSDAIMSGKAPASVDIKGRVTDVPDNFKEWVENNEGRIQDAINSGKELPYFLRDNGTVDDNGVFHINDFTTPKHELTILEKAQMRHAARTDEEVADIHARAEERQQRLKEYGITKNRASNFLGMAGDWHEVDFSSLQDLFAQVQGKSFYRPAEMADLKKAVADIKAQIQAQQAAEKALSDVIPDVHKWHTQFGISDLQSVKDAVGTFHTNKATKKFYKDWDSIPLAEKKKILEDEIKYVSDPTYHKPHTLHSTWEVAQAVYKKELAEVERQILMQPFEDKYKLLSAFVSKSPAFNNAMLDAQKAIATGDVALVQKALDKAEKEKQRLDKDAYRRKLAKLKSRDIKGVPEKERQKLIDAFEAAKGTAEDAVESADKLLRKATEQGWANMSAEERYVLTKYTQTYSYLNEPLTGRKYSGSWRLKDFEDDMPRMTIGCDEVKTTKHMVVRRGTDDYPIPALGKNLSQVEVGDEFVNGCFLSSSVRVDMGFFKSYNLVIVVPKGTHGIYAEPFTHYGGGCFDYQSNNLWNGVSKEHFGTEREWIGQRGFKFKVIEKKGHTIYLEIIGELYDQVTDYKSYIS